MKHWVVRYMVPQETWVAADDTQEAKQRANKLLALHNTGFCKPVLHSIEPAPTNEVNEADVPPPPA